MRNRRFFSGASDTWRSSFRGEVGTTVLWTEGLCTSNVGSVPDRDSPTFVETVFDSVRSQSYDCPVLSEQEDGIARAVPTNRSRKVTA